MRREQIWCDHCGRLIQDKSLPNGSQDLNNMDKSWELWSPKENSDHVLCSLQCVVEKASVLMIEETRTNNLEQPLG